MKLPTSFSRPANQIPWITSPKRLQYKSGMIYESRITSTSEPFYTCNARPKLFAQKFLVSQKPL